MNLIILRFPSGLQCNQNQHHNCKGQVEEQYLTENYSAPDQIFYLMIDEAAGKVSTPVHYMNEEMKEIVSDVLGDGNWKIFVGLDTNYHCKTSPSYFDSMFYTFYKNTSEQQIGRASCRERVFITV